MAPRSRAAETAAINNLIFASQELAQRMAILEATMKMIETSIARIEATIEMEKRAKRVDVLSPIHALETE